MGVIAIFCGICALVVLKPAYPEGNIRRSQREHNDYCEKKRDVLFFPRFHQQVDADDE